MIYFLIFFNSCAASSESQIDSGVSNMPSLDSNTSEFRGYENIHIGNMTCFSKEHHNEFNGENAILTQITCGKCVDSMRQ